MKELIKSKLGFWLMVIMAAGLGLFFVQAYCTDQNTPQNSICGNLGSTLLIGGGITFVLEGITKLSTYKDIMELIRISITVKENGLESIHNDCYKYDFTNSVKTSREFCAIMNNGNVWVNTYKTALRERFDSKKKLVTEFFFVNPDSPFLEVLAQKKGKGKDFIKGRIKDTVETLKNEYKKSKQRGELRIYYLKHFPTQAQYFFDKRVVVSPYLTSGEKKETPLFEYSYGTDRDKLANALREDLELVRAEAKLEFGSHRKGVTIPERNSTVTTTEDVDPSKKPIVNRLNGHKTALETAFSESGLISTKEDESIFFERKDSSPLAFSEAADRLLSKIREKN